MEQTTNVSTASRTASLSGSAGQLIRILVQNRVWVLLVALLFGLAGIGLALMATPEFVSEARIMPEMNSGSNDVFKRLASVAGFAGIDLAETEGVDAVRPDLYPNVLQSTPFILYLLDRPVRTRSGTDQTVTSFLETHKSWSVAKFLARNEEPQRLIKNAPGQPMELTRQQQDLVEEVQKRVSARLDTRSGIITITAKMPDANVAAGVAQLAMDYLTQYVTSYRTEKARQDLQFYADRLSEARRRYQNAQKGVFEYNDQHRYMVVQAATMDKQRREAELSIAQTVYTELARQYEQARLKVQERTPVFKVLEPANVPLIRVSPKRTVMVLFYTLAGFVVGSLTVLAIRLNLAERLKTLMAR
ncbi:lipopolysaccharide biosynthesis protein [Fibrisoma montanum]|uniref:Lipopolysaccharide biosynthesis protein n=1 Tax=Fibrisoma montanum TaxID=2305895 RepID=A0A418M1A9_9BACT|nr:Wzz/FepE/Etk N-terminal domain-containing protein [Fibrisoma montanum]RIV19393.1 lipopolysaccharide biosynthesis protein [Fibrisoma montanum]